MRKIDYIIVIVLLLFVFVPAGIGRVILETNEILYITYSQELIDEAIIFYDYEASEIPCEEIIVQDIAELYDKVPIYKYKDIGQKFARVPIIGINNIYLKPTINIRYLPFVLAHELEHTNFVMNEFTANYNAITKLLESDKLYLQAIAKRNALYALRGGYSRKNRNYDCTELLVEYYLKETAND